MMANSPQRHYMRTQKEGERERERGGDVYHCISIYREICKHSDYISEHGMSHLWYTPIFLENQAEALINVRTVFLAPFPFGALTKKINRQSGFPLSTVW